MTEREMLELAALAAGLRVTWEPVHNCYWVDLGQGLEYRPWAPRTDNGDALWLAMRLNMCVSIHDNHCMACAQTGTMQTVRDIQTEEATRLAIVLAAAVVGKAMQEGK